MIQVYRYSKTRICPICRGIGIANGKICYYCGGNGRVSLLDF